MFWHVIRKDLVRKKTMNIILFLFIILAAMFLASSANNLLAATTSLDSYFDRAAVPDYLILMRTRGDADARIRAWLDTREDIDEYEAIKLCYINQSDTSFAGGKTYEAKNVAMFFPPTQQFGMLFDEQDNPMELREGEIALPLMDKALNDVALGDTMTIHTPEGAMTFTVAAFLKDALFGSDMMGVKRCVLSEGDYNRLEAALPESQTGAIYMLRTQQTEAVRQSFSALGISPLAALDKSTIRMTYVMDLIMAGILIAVSVCLLLISFLLLRFTIQFTMQEDFREIGVMKAIGLPSAGIRRIYVMKYLAISVLGAAIGFGASFPFGQLLLDSISRNIILQPSGSAALLNLVCAAAVVAIVVLFCYVCTGRLKRFSPIDAIRDGSTGERFVRKGFLRLEKSRLLRPIRFLAINDVLGNARRFAILFVTFLLSLLLLTLPMSAAHTLQGPQMLRLMGMADADAYANSAERAMAYMEHGSRAYIEEDIRRIERDLAEQGIHAELSINMLLNSPLRNSQAEQSLTIQGVQAIGIGVDFAYCLKGSLPLLENELALSPVSAKELEVTVGDTVFATIGEEERPFLVTGLIDSMNNMGKTILYSEATELDYRGINGFFPFQIRFTDEGLSTSDKARLTELLEEALPSSYEVNTVAETIDTQMGSIVEQIDGVKLLILLLVLCIVFLVTMLLLKSFIAKETGEIAMLKSIGFRNGAVKAWQISRVAVVFSLAMIAGSMLSNVANDLIVGAIFSMMGAQGVEITTDSLSAFVLSPLLMLGTSLLAATISAGSIGRISVRETNNLE